MKPSLTIAIPAYNEEKNIAKLLNSLLNQKITRSELKEILVIDDGSKDNTLKEIKKVKSNFIRLHVDGKNLGKSQRLNEIFKFVSTDLLITFDADTIPINVNSVENLLIDLCKPEITLVSGNPKKKVRNNNLDSTLEISAELQEYIKLNLNNGDNVYACHGRFIGIKKKIYKKLNIPPESVGNDAFIYFSNKEMNGKFAYSDNAKVIYKMPANEKDFAKQRSRFKYSKQLNNEIFKDKLNILNEYRIPKTLILKASVNSFIKSPFQFIKYTLLIFKSSKAKHNKKNAWEVSETTK